VGYRVLDRGEVVFAGTDAVLDAADRTDSTAAVRAALTAVRVRPGGGERGLTRRQRRLLNAYGVALAAAEHPAAHPYPPGTRVRVSDPTADHPVGGTVLAAVVDRDGDLRYQWRPDAADLPGHPWRDQPGWALHTAATQVHATLDSPDLHTANPDGQPALLATGALVAAIDDPRFTTATVLRAYAGDGPGPRYEIQPHDSGGGPVEIPVHEVTGVAGTAWPSVHDLLLARAGADLPLRPFEVVIALRDCGIVTDSPHGPHLHTRYLLHDVGAALDPAHSAAPVRCPTPVDAPPRLPTLSATGGVVRLDDPAHGRLAVPAPLMTAALDAGPGPVAAILARRPWLPAGPHPPIVAAALAALHAPGEVATLTAAPPTADPSAPGSGQTPRDGPPAPAGPVMPGPGGGGGPDGWGLM
jgi:hypothetical protein